MVKQGFWITCLALSCLGIYLFVSAPPPLQDKKATGPRIPVQKMFEILAAENNTVRTMWTKDVVGAGKQAGLKFDENWRDAEIEAGPLPALFLRETAKSLEKHPTPLSLFLGSDYPINTANRFTGLQLEKFQTLKQTQQAQFFHMDDINMQVAMFADLAVSDGCVQCHNKHEQSPKRDWKLNDMMGATTWMYPEAEVSLDTVLKTLDALHQGYREAYQAYVEKARTFANPPAIGEHWPGEGYYLPSIEVFMREIIKRTAPHTLETLVSLTDRPAATGSVKTQVSLTDKPNTAHALETSHVNR